MKLELVKRFSRIPHRQHLIYQQNLRIQMRCHRESQPHVHPAGEMLDRCVNEPLHPRKMHDLVELAVNPSAGSGQVSAFFTPRLVLSSVEGLSKGWRR